jgi:hypothetical protein
MLSPALLSGALTVLEAALDSDDDDEPVNRQGQGPRNRAARKPSSETKWWKDHKLAEANGPGSVEARRFRRRFRVSHKRFLELVATTKTWTTNVGGEERPVFPQCGEHDRKTVPPEIKAMLALRWLATGASFDTLAELSETSETTARRACLDWCRHCAANLHKKWVCVPDDLQGRMEIYGKLGFPGAAGSMDVVHVALDKCSASTRSIHQGKEGYPTLGFEVVADHLRWIQAVSPSFPGAVNDKTICRYDGFVRDLRSGQLFKDVTYKLYKSDGSQITRRDPYLIVDGGYHKWKELQAVMKGLSEPSEVACSHLRRL